MPRIRSIKPEFWSSPAVAKMSPLARLTFIAMWNWADDCGRGTYNPRELMGFAFPLDEEMTAGEFRRLVGEIHLHVGVVFYNVGERHFFTIPSWSKHQKSDPRFKGSKYPSFEEGVEIDPVSMQVKGNVDDSHTHVGGEHLHADDSRTHVALGTGEQGNRGTDISIAHPAEAREKNPYPQDFEDWYQLWPRKKSKGDALKAFKAAKKKISVDELMERTRLITGAWQAQGKESQFIPYPATWLRADGWEDDLTEPARRNSNSFLEFSQALRSVDGDQRAIG